MILRPRQKVLVDRCVTALGKHNNTLAVAPTGSGKTVMLSELIRRLRCDDGRAIILQHRDELTAQNRRTFHVINPGVRSSGIIDATGKDFSSNIAFAMVPTLARNLEHLNGYDLAIIDEAHHATAASYRRIVERLRELNPNMLLAGFTATAQRGDKTPLREVFDNVADQITLGEMIRDGHLVRPRAFVIDLGVQEELKDVRQTASDYDMKEVASILDRQVLNEKVVEHWRQHAADRQTVVFCSTVEHAAHVKAAFMTAGVSACMVWGDMDKPLRKIHLAAFDSGEFQVVVNVAVLTEGWDCPRADCIVLLRPCSYKSTMIQMIGRGLRKIAPDQYPNVIKNDCIVLDFGTSLLMHGSIEMTADLETDAETKECPECHGEIPRRAKECELCGYVFPVGEDEEVSVTIEGGIGDPKEALGEFVLNEIDIMKASPFQWEEFFDGRVMIANGFEAWGMVVWYEGQWRALGAKKKCQIRHLNDSDDRALALASADDFIRINEQEDAAHKSRRWLRLPASDRQLEYLCLRGGAGSELNRYRASCMLTWQFNEARVQTKITELAA